MGVLCNMFKTLVLSGGAIKGVAFVGCLKYLEENNMMDSMNTFVGSSSGSIISFLIALGYKHHEIWSLCKEGIQKYKEHDLNLDTIFNIVQTMGLDDGHQVTEFLVSCLEKKGFSGDMSFIEFAKITGKHLVICASCINTHTDTYFSVDESPNMPVVLAIRASISIPFIFTPVQYNDQLYVDAGLLNNFPIEKIRSAVANECLGIMITGKCYTSNHYNLFTFARMLLESMVIKVNRKDQTSLMYHVIIDLQDPNEDIFKFDYHSFKLDIDDRGLERFFNMGYERIKTQLLSQQPISDPQ